MVDSIPSRPLPGRKPATRDRVRRPPPPGGPWSESDEPWKPQLPKDEAASQCDACVVVRCDVRCDVASRGEAKNLTQSVNASHARSDGIADSSVSLPCESHSSRLVESRAWDGPVCRRSAPSDSTNRDEGDSQVSGANESASRLNKRAIAKPATATSKPTTNDRFKYTRARARDSPWRRAGRHHVCARWRCACTLGAVRRHKGCPYLFIPQRISARARRDGG